MAYEQHIVVEQYTVGLSGAFTCTSQSAPSSGVVLRWRSSDSGRKTGSACIRRDQPHCVQRIASRPRSGQRASENTTKGVPKPWRFCEATFEERAKQATAFRKEG